METISKNEVLVADIWQKIPADEKVALRSKAQSTGVTSVVCLLIFTAAAAVGLKMPWIFWGAFFFVPFVFQITTARAWHTHKPRLIVTYTAIRAAACHYATRAGGKSFSPLLVFQAHVKKDNPPSSLDESIETAPEESEVQGKTWVTLFPDSLVAFSETPLGTRLVIAHSIFDEISLPTEDGEESMSESEETRLITRDERGNELVWTISGAPSSTLLTFKRKLGAAFSRRDRIREESAREMERLASSASRRHDTQNHAHEEHASA